MFYRLSLTSGRRTLEREFGRTFAYPSLYSPQPRIDGMEEATLPVVLSEHPEHIGFSIWGLLPEGFSDDWDLFQGGVNTLNLGPGLLRARWIWESLLLRRCLILTDGFFATFGHGGKLFPYLVYREDRQPFALAGVYNRLDDGFVSCSFLLGPATPLLRRIHNLGPFMPRVLNRTDREAWLEPQGESSLRLLLESTRPPELQAHPIARELFFRGITYRSMLDPVYYEDLPAPRP